MLVAVEQRLCGSGRLLGHGPGRRSGSSGQRPAPVRIGSGASGGAVRARFLTRRREHAAHRKLAGVLSREDNELVCRVGPGTPMGNLMREYWIPVLQSEDLPF